MKSIINGKTYNTETATRLAGYKQMTSDGFWVCNTNIEVLYRTPKGALFLHVIHPDAGGYLHDSDSEIAPLDETDVVAWVEKRHIDLPDFRRAGQPQAPAFV
jgi:hypothetical protein